MREKISILFFCVASVLIVMQIITSFSAVQEDRVGAKPLYSFHLEQPIIEKIEVNIDFRKLAEDLSKDKY
ncbi:hypothetical protein L4D20_23550 [Vibrio kyushuensis]|uniref:hypothetical protein n=1 Tax=Vibrio kyushuensis TaxID=2910249 RepID=UPI003D1245AA